MAGDWDPGLYLRYADDRARPYVDLVARVDAQAPATVVDLGCGPGGLTATLTRRWPDARVTGVDASPAMVERAAQRHPGVSFELGDVRDWTPSEPVDVLISNATLQWLPDHLELLPRLAAQVAPDGWFAFQVPGNFAAPSHTIRAELAADPRFAAHTAHVDVPDSHDALTYLEALAALGWQVDAWETTYLHRLTGADPVFTWVSSTGARPTLQALPPGLREEFEAEFRARLAQAYPARHGAVTLPFRRIFVVAHRPPPLSAGR